MDGAPFHSTPERARIRVTGAVQGVGFRPHVWKLAQKHKLVGWVKNDEKGVLIEAQGANLVRFTDDLKAEAPPLARIDGVNTIEVEPSRDSTFKIIESEKTARAQTVLPPDSATCDDCISDIFNPSNRRYLYPFTNCTNCGPRYTIAREAPYDRARTSMDAFEMCPECQKEYEDPSDRRFHAQPNACPVCGPKYTRSTRSIFQALLNGSIVALKGIGGFHLVVDAHNPDAVNKLRKRKKRDGKPFAVMVLNEASAARIVDLDPVSRTVLKSAERPVLVARKKHRRSFAEVSNGLPSLGVMLPYAPIHSLIFWEALGRPSGDSWLKEETAACLVMTSANLSGEPLVADMAVAQQRLEGVADLIVDHDRAIVTRCDDSVVRIINGAPTYIRRSRGAALSPIKLSQKLPATVAFGAALKNTVCVIRDDEAFVSQHVGDVENPESLNFLQETAEHLCSTLEVSPERVGCDMHPDFLSTRAAEDMGLPIVRVQHHHAHLAGLAAEHKIDQPFLGVALDGFGLGVDRRSSWGGELLWLNGAGFERVGSLAPLQQPGGDKAAQEPWRMGAAALKAVGREDLIRQRYGAQQGVDLVATMLERETLSPPTSSAGRLFDAAASLLNINQYTTFEGEAAMRLEGLVTRPRAIPGGWRIDGQGELSFYPLLQALITMDAEEGANAFHGTLAAGLCDWIRRALDERGKARFVGLSGGCFQNRVLTECVINELARDDIKVLTAGQAPANDGGISLGQAWVAALTDLSTEGVG
ncbi:MAG: carbamoyltransferase HypF [Pseudomonadota bacterium]